MNGISHNQAMKWIHSRLDGLLTGDQGLVLDEHLDSCETCRAYAAEMNVLPARLQREFHARWDEPSGPSQKVLEQVTTRAKRIQATNRISSGVRAFAGVAALIVLAFLINLVVSRLRSSSTSAFGTETADNSALAENRLLAFTSDQNGNFDIYTMHADGSGLTNITNNPATDTNPAWSPDGKRIAFESDRDSFRQIYLMDIDGSNVVQLTKDEADHAFANDVNNFSPWSPDGSRLLMGEKLPGEEKGKLYVLEVNGGHKTLLVDEPDIYSAISWSPDGRHIALQGYEHQNTSLTYLNRLYIVNADGSGLREMTASIRQNEPLSFTQDYHWSADGQSIFFVALLQKTDNWYWIAYEARLDDHSLIEHATTTDLMYGWWNGIYIVNNSSASAPFEWVRPDGTSSKWNPKEECQHIDLYQSDDTVKRSPNGNWVVTGQCANGDTWLYWANSDGSEIELLLDSPISITNTFLSPVSWSPDDNFVAFTASTSDESDLYILDVSEALHDWTIQPVKVSKSYGLSWQPVLSDEVVEENPTPAPAQDLASDDLIAFASEQSGDLEIYTMRADGTGMTNITNNPANDYSPVWSPDGQRIAFVSNRDGNDNIYVMNGDSSSLNRITEDITSDMVPVWSPDGTKIAYASRDSDTKLANLYVSDSTGQNRRRLTNDVPEMVWPETWSPDSQYLFFLIDGQIFKVNVDSGDTTAVTLDEDVYSLVLSKDGSRLLYLGWCGRNSNEFCNTVKSINEDGTNAETHTTVQLQQVCTLREPSSTNVAEHHEMVKWSPDRTKILVAFYCEENGGLFYIANADGSDFKPLTNYPILYKASGFDWSPDSQSIIFSSALDNSQIESIYTLNINDALQDPEIRPTQWNASVTQIASFTWQPVSNDGPIEEKPTPTP